MKKVLITGFEPFGGETINPSWEAVKALPDQIDGTIIKKLSLPVVFGKSGDMLISAINTEKPHAVICVGQAGGKASINVERIAINVDDTKTPDNEGNTPIDQPIRDGAPVAYFATLPVKSIVANLIKAHIPATISNTAGTYVCNHVMYAALHHASRHHPTFQAGFIHIPYLPAQVLEKPATPSMSLDNVVKALEIIIRSTI
ncbi:MAG: pyroglutamyl-peptidase I [Defluviitaleaceae bacterium]|nr:pyroglutamyl-peptidase I [Defluviitaleaceae bacterium]